MNFKLFAYPVWYKKHLFHRVLDLEKKKETVHAVSVKSSHDKGVQESSEDDDDFDEFLDWRAKKSFKWNSLYSIFVNNNYKLYINHIFVKYSRLRIIVEFFIIFNSYNKNYLQCNFCMTIKKKFTNLNNYVNSSAASGFSQQHLRGVIPKYT